MELRPSDSIGEVRMAASAVAVSEDVPYSFLPPLARGRRGNTTQQVQDLIRDAIVRLAFTPGEFIRKDAICQRLGVSRFPVSEALGRLADEGFVDILPQRGTRVSRIDISACRHAMFMRRAIEAEAMRVIAPRVNDILIARMEDNLGQQEEAMQRADGASFFHLDHAFHDLLLGELGYRRVQSVVDAARGKLDRTREYLLRSQHRQSRSYLEHVAIAEALKRRDAEGAQHAMARHLDRTMEEIERRAAENPQIFTTAAA
jgi:DNA-binding GntR family transcriptional regulator